MITIAHNSFCLGELKKLPANLRKFKIKHFPFLFQFCVSVWIPTDIHLLCFYLKTFDILITGCSRLNILKQTDVSILGIHEKEKGTFQVVPILHKLPFSYL